jgi:hypothetical protein
MAAAGQHCFQQEASSYQVTATANDDVAGDKSQERHRASGESGHPATAPQSARTTGQDTTPHS